MTWIYAGAVKIVHCYYLTVIVKSQTVASCCQSDAAPPPHTAKCSSLKKLKLKNLIFKFNSGVSRKIRRTWDRPRPLHQLTLLVPVSHNLAFYTITRSCSQGAAPGTLHQPPASWPRTPLLSEVSGGRWGHAGCPEMIEVISY